MDVERKNQDPSHVLILIFIYAILGPAGVTPVALGIAAVLLARFTPILDFVIAEYESFHGQRERLRFDKIKADVTESIRRDVSAQYTTEHAGLKAQIGLLTSEFRSLQDNLAIKTTTIADSNSRIEELRKEHDALHAEIKTLKSRLRAVDINSKRHVTVTTPGVPISSSTPASTPAESASVQLVAPKPSEPAQSPIVLQQPASPKEPEPQIQPLRIELPSELRYIDPTRPGFTCIGRAVATHGGPCRSYSNEFLPKRKLAQAGTTLDDMKSGISGSDFELLALRDLADKMLCIHHGRNCKYDQVDSIARKWYDALAPARAQLKERAQQLRTPVKVARSGIVPGSAGSAGSIGSRPVSPASSSGGSVSTAATTPDAFEDRGVKTETGVGNSPFIFGAGQAASFGSPSPAPRGVSRLD